MNPFETETMADLCIRQGHLDEALAILTRLAVRAADDTTRARIRQRIIAIETSPPEQGPSSPPPAAEPPLPVPGVRTRVSDDVATVEWRLPAGTSTPTLQLLLVSRTPAGVSTETRSVPADHDTGQLVLSIPGLHSIRVAAGFTVEGRFVPLARA